MFFLRLGIIFLGIVNKTHPFDLNVIATTAWIAGSLYCGDSPRHCAMFPRATLSSDSILRSHQDNFSRGSSPSGFIYNIYNIYITLLTLYNIIDKIYNIYPASYWVTATQQRGINLSTHHHRCRQCEHPDYCNSVLHPLLQRHTSSCGHFYHFHQL